MDDPLPPAPSKSGLYDKPVQAVPRRRGLHRPLLVLSRQRLVGKTNGSSTYLLAICEALRAEGWEPHLLQPSPVIFGRWPVLRLRAEMEVFASIRVRGGLRIGPFLLCGRLSVWLAAARHAFSRLANRAGFPDLIVSRPAPYAIAAPWSVADFAFTNQWANRIAQRGQYDVLADYVFQNALLPYCPQARRRIVVMHDLFCARARDFYSSGEIDSTACILEQEEMKLLDESDIIVAIQRDEAEFVACRTKSAEVVVAPFGLEPKQHPQPGRDGEILFVGSNTAPNVSGLRWFLSEIWPQVRATNPAAQLSVAGSVARGISERPDGVRFLGVISDLQALYASSAVVISPLLAGSGLKIKLAEALGEGKAVVATPATFQGVEEIADIAAVMAKDAISFRQAVCGLLYNSEARRSLGVRALWWATQLFSLPAACGPLVAAIE
jgi:succinoglycan biosynthesis protein ExoO